MSYGIVITESAEHEIDSLRAFDRQTVLKALEMHLRHQPMQESRSRIKKLTQPAISQFRLRVGEYRVYYDVDEANQRVVILQVYAKGRSSTRGQGDA